MNRNLMLCAAILWPAFAFCQPKTKDYLPFGKLDKTEFIKKQCDFDDKAGAEILSDVGEFKADIIMGRLVKIFSRHRRIKILSSKGFEKANIKIPYIHHGNKEQVVHLTAVTYNLDAQENIVSKNVEKSQVFNKKISSRYSEITFTFSEIKAGSIIEYKYEVQGAGMRDWYLQDDVPVRFSSYTINLPEMFEVHTRPVCSLPYSSNDNSAYKRTIKQVTMKNVPALRDEAFITCADDYLQKVESWLIAYTVDNQRHTLLKTWNEVADELYDDEDFGKQLSKNIPRTTDLDDSLKHKSDPIEKMKTIHNYVKKNMSWDGNDNIWALNGVKSAWKERKGTSGEINLILVNLLKDANLDANPLLVSTREHGTPSTLWTDISQFNKVVALVTIGDHQYVVDGTDMYTPTGMIPADLLYTEGLVLDKREPLHFRWHELDDSTAVESNMVVVQARLTENGAMDGHARVKSEKYARIKRVTALKQGVEDYMEKFLKKANPAISIDSMEIGNRDAESLPLDQSFHFTLPVNSSGDYSYFSTNLFTGIESNPFIADTRFSDVFFGTCQKYILVGYLKIPDGYTLEELPKDIRMMLADRSLSITRQAVFGNQALMTRITIEYKRPFYPVAEYADLREFYKKMYALLDEQFVMHKISTASK